MGGRGGGGGIAGFAASTKYASARTKCICTSISASIAPSIARGTMQVDALLLWEPSSARVGHEGRGGPV